MSRTFKDRPHHIKYPKWDIDYIWNDGYGYRKAKTSIPKKRKEVNTEDHWMSTPSWWTRLMMGKPERRQAHMLERKALRVEDIEDMDFPNLKRKPHIYFW